MPTRKVNENWTSHSKCRHPEHNPPKMEVMEPGLYEHECPSCGYRQMFRVAEKPVYTERYYRLGWSDHTEYEATVYAESPEEAEEKLGTWISDATPEQLAKYVRRSESTSDDFIDCGAVDTREKALEEMNGDDEEIIGEP